LTHTAPPPACFNAFESDIQGIELPEVFTFPFQYEPHALSRLAAEQVQRYLAMQQDWQHNFDALGKMFGVLVVQTTDGQIGFLAAFSGKLAESNHLPGFVPPVFDLLDTAGFFKSEEADITYINHQIEHLEATPNYLEAVTAWRRAIQDSERDLISTKEKIQTQKNERAARRAAAMQTLSGSALESALNELNNESAQWAYYVKDLKRQWHHKISGLEAIKDEFQSEIESLKNQRKQMSAALQAKIFDHYRFLNSAGQHRSIADIFGSEPPPAGAGECAAPKLLQYAFAHGLRPVAMAEFWWGVSPSSEVRKHGLYYPACKSKCEPILGHMLSGMALMPDLRKVNPALGKSLDTVWEDEHIAVVYKPHDFFSVPGKQIVDSVLTRMREKYPDATGPLLVHRLDVATSGLLIIAKSMLVYQHLQSQFLKRKVQKRYVALLDGIVQDDAGLVDLPLRVDLDDRPRQMVCYKYGKPAQTQWRVLDRSGGRTKIEFTPLTGRTHQLRVHAAHTLGLNLPITGDELYGTKSDRMYLHAEALTFEHPVKGEAVFVERLADF
jgi:tRNA pseudouridine32 synthase / 23S rRNA pseudouridine746 synthase